MSYTSPVLCTPGMISRYSVSAIFNLQRLVSLSRNNILGLLIAIRQALLLASGIENRS